MAVDLHIPRWRSGGADEAVEEGTYDVAVLHWIESSGFEAILIPWGLDRDPALELMAGLRPVDSGTWTELTTQYQNPTTTTIVEAAETTPSTTPIPDAVTGPPAVVSIDEFDTEPGYSRFDGEGLVGEVLGSTGIAYDEFPDFVPDAAVDNGRVVIVGGNAERIAGIWYSDDGTWTTAEIVFPDGVRIGESDGDMRLADGIQNVETDGRVFVAWEPVQVVKGQEPTSAGTIVFTSSDGANWSAHVTATDVAGLIPWNGGYIATYRDRSNDPATWILGWSLDLTNWVELVDLGRDVAYAVESSGHGVLVRQEAGADGSVDGIIMTTEVAFAGGDRPAPTASGTSGVPVIYRIGYRLILTQINNSRARSGPRCHHSEISDSTPRAPRLAYSRCRLCCMRSQPVPGIR